MHRDVLAEYTLWGGPWRVERRNSDGGIKKRILESAKLRDISRCKIQSYSSEPVPGKCELCTGAMDNE